MRNILKMNLFRMKQTKTTYILALVAVGLSLLLFFISYLTNQMMFGMSLVDVDGEIPISVFQAVFMSGTIPGAPLAALLFILLFVNSEYSSGYAKNLVGYEGNKLACAGANLITIAIYSFIVTVLSSLVSVLASLAFYKKTNFDGAPQFFGYLFVMFLETVAFTQLVLAWSEKKGKYVLKMILGVVCLIYAMMIYQLINLGVAWIWEKEFSIGKYTLLGGLSTLTLDSSAGDFVRSGLIAVAVIVAAYFLDVVALKKRELK